MPANKNALQQAAKGKLGLPVLCLVAGAVLLPVLRKSGRQVSEWQTVQFTTGSKLAVG